LVVDKYLSFLKTVSTLWPWKQLTSKKQALIRYHAFTCIVK